MIRPILLLLVFSATHARADSPLPPPGDHEVRSPNGRCTAWAEVASAQVRVIGRASGGEVISWSVPGWHRALLVGNDCRLLGVVYAGQNLLNLGDRQAATPVLTFHGIGGIVRVVRLGDLYPDLMVLPRTASHWSWQQGSEWDGRRWTVHTVDGRVLTFAP